ncbi:MAG: DUF4003 family protein [Planctomycetota bacterium]
MIATVPSDPLGRFIAIASELAAHKRWWEGPTLVRYAALPLVLAPGAPAALAERVDCEGGALVKEQGWFSDLRGGMRFFVAGWLVASGRVPSGFTSACEAIRERLRAASVRRGGAYEVVAITMLHVAGGGDETTVQRLQQIYEMMRRHHWWLTGPDDLPACALLALRGGDVPGIEARVEGVYERLRQHGISAGSGLQMASHIACLVPASEADVVQRFVALHSGFKANGVQMWDSDLDEIALLCLLDQDAETTVRTVLDHRAELKAKLRVSGPTVDFSLACGTAFLAAHAGVDLDRRLSLDIELANFAMAANAARIHEAAKQASHGAS